MTGAHQHRWAWGAPYYQLPRGLAGERRNHQFTRGCVVLHLARAAV